MSNEPTAYNAALAAECAELRQRLRAMESENGTLRGFVEAVAVCPACDCCAETARTILGIVRAP